MKHSVNIVALVALLLCLLGSCHRRQPTATSSSTTVHDLPQIRHDSELVVLTLYGSMSYFIYRGQDMGFQYELAKQFAHSIGVRLRIKVADNSRQLIQLLQEGKGDLIAYDLAITRERRDSLIFCGKSSVTHQVLVQRAQRGREPINNVTQLIGKDVYVKPGKHYERLVNLNKELGGGIRIHQVTTDSLTAEDLIGQVAQGAIPYTVADNNLAQLNRTYYANLNIDLVISYDQRSSWAVRRDCPLLAEAADSWQRQNTQSSAYRASAKRYFEIGKQMPHTPILSLQEGKISHYDGLFKKYAPLIGWDWRLLASLAYTESNFDTTAVSWAGALGLMQLMPGTAHAMGIPPGKEQNPEESVRAAVKYIGITMQSFKHLNTKEQIQFTLAAYNAGIGHVLDARALARKYGKDPDVWEDNVETFIILKSEEKYFTDSVCRFGYFRGRETYNFVRDITRRYEVYKTKIK